MNAPFDLGTDSAQHAIELDLCRALRRAVDSRVAELVQRQNSSDSVLPYQDVYYSPSTAPYIHGRFLPKDKPPELSREAQLKKKLRKLLLKPDLFFADALANRATRLQKRVLARHDPEDPATK